MNGYEIQPVFKGGIKTQHALTRKANRCNLQVNILLLLKKI